MKENKLRGWLLQLPKPTLIRVKLQDGEVEELKPHRKSFAKTAETILALDPESVQLLDDKGQIIRAVTVDGEDFRRSDAPPMPQVIANDPHAALMTHFANLLHRAYEHSTEVAFVKIVELVERMGDRSDAIEQRLERAEARVRRAQEDQIEDAYVRAQELADQAQAGAAGGVEGIGQQLVSSFISGQMQRGAANGASNGASNGKGKA